MATRSERVPEIVHFTNGKLKMKGFRLDDEMHGPWEWGRDGRHRDADGEFDRGKQVGVWRTFDRSGRLACLPPLPRVVA